jgi:hypothetical protein
MVIGLAHKICGTLICYGSLRKLMKHPLMLSSNTMLLGSFLIMAANCYWISRAQEQCGGVLLEMQIKADLGEERKYQQQTRWFILRKLAEN